MKRGQSYITLSSEETPNDPMIKALHEKGLRYIIIIYASHLATDAGWTMIRSNKGHYWFGYTRKESMKAISKLDIDKDLYSSMY